MPGRSKVEGGKGEEEEEDEVWQVEKEVMNAVLAAGSVISIISGDLAGKV